jgi:hypothetical protein
MTCRTNKQQSKFQPKTLKLSKLKFKTISDFGFRGAICCGSVGCKAQLGFRSLGASPVNGTPGLLNTFPKYSSTKRVIFFNFVP